MSKEYTQKFDTVVPSESCPLFYHPFGHTFETR